jgi:pimeloyl-ACP methyl ester carboxylesterase
MQHAVQPVSRHFTSQSLNLHYLDWGNEGAPTLILQHGGFDHAHSMDWIARELAADWHVVAPDLRGHGDSAWSPDADYTMPALLLDFANLVEVLGGGPLAICAHSLGPSSPRAMRGSILKR